MGKPGRHSINTKRVAMSRLKPIERAINDVYGLEGDEVEYIITYGDKMTAEKSSRSFMKTG